MVTFLIKSAYQKIFLDNNGHLVLAQFPNIPLAIWLSTLVIARLVHASPWVAINEVVSFSALLVWAFLELVSGVTYFRRTLGLIVFVYLLANKLT